MLSRAPFVGIVLCFIAGILLLDSVIDERLSHFALPGSCGLALIACVIFYSKNLRSAFGISFAVFLLLIGVFAKNRFERNNDDNLATLSSQAYHAYEAEITTLPEKRAKTIRFGATVKHVQVAGKWVAKNIKAMINISQDATAIPRPGDHILVHGTLELPQQATNPAQFDYRGYLRNKGIVWTDYLSKTSFEIVPGKGQLSFLQSWAIHISEWSDRVFRENLKEDAAYGLVKAMLLGRRDDLQMEQVTDYTISGAVHIVSVSGMHVAIIFLVISHLMGWMKRWRFGKVFYFVTVTALLCFYALVTGLPPSVQRATLMCVVFVAAEIFGRKHQAMNTLALSAFLILLLDPAALYDVGFQLSYLAMAGIFLLYEPINGIFQPENRILKFAWQITALSFAAQLATFPLSLFYFHQFPTYFWLVNPFVIAFTNVLLPGAMLLLIVSLLPVFWLQWLVSKVVWMCAYLTDLSASIPKVLSGNLIENLHLDEVEVLCLYAVLFSIWLAFYFRNIKYLRSGSVLVLFMTCYSLSKSIQTHFSEQIVVHDIPKHSVVSVKQDDLLYIVCDKSFRGDQDAYNFYIKNYAIEQEVTRTVFVTTH